MNNAHIDIQPHSSLRDILQAILKDARQSPEKTVPPKFRNKKLLTIYLETHIEFNKFFDRTGVEPPANALLKTGKRTWKNSVSEGSVLKRSRLYSGDSRMLKSQFVLGSSTSIVPPAPSTQVTLFFAKLASNIATGEQSFAWDIDGSASHSGKLADIPVDKGKLKFVFKVLILDGTPYVAKRCFALGDGSPVSILGNREQLVKEATTLGRTLKISRGNVKRKE
ncbi:hypothetical protein R3P38DRAFT_2772360 [Favolaschia claudopus]|uniref:Uncharacterized protein n=1 Tax=Favolaschia claudopus TaxID=2862362 RepID=A0AAW0AN33_9AGAR